MGKKNLDGILIKNESILPEETERTYLKKKDTKKNKEIDSETLSIKISPTEMSVLLKKKEEEVGKMVPLGTYVKFYLRNKTSIFVSV